jgi:hypothetical protein
VAIWRDGRTRIVGLGREMRTNGSHGAASRTRRTSGLGRPAGGVSAIGAGELRPHPTAAGIPDRGAIVLGAPTTDRPGTPDRPPPGNRKPSRCRRNERAGRPFGEDASDPGTSKDARVCGRGRRGGKEASRTGKCSPPDGWILAEMTSAAGLVAGGERSWRGSGPKARAQTAQEPMMCRLTCANVAERARIYGILSRELPPLCAPRTRLFRHRRAVAL